MKSLLYAVVILFVAMICLTSCGDDEPNQKVYETGSVMDHEGNTYKTIKIGNQWWMQEDLKVTTLKNGDDIKFFGDFDGTLWENTQLPGYCKGETGYLYNFYSISNPIGIAPEGWRVPTDADWQKLESFLGMAQNELDQINWRGTEEGNKLKQDYQESGWIPFGNVWSENESGFTALACGCRLPDGKKCSPAPAKQGFWWTSSAFENKAWFRNLDYKKSGILRYFVDQNYGMGIRCIKN